MKRSNLNKPVLSILMVILVTAIFISGCGKKDSNEVTENKKNSETSKENSASTESNNNTDMNSPNHIMINLPTMQCSTCKKNIETAVKKLDGIESINVVVKEKVAHINFDKSKTDLTKIEGAITAAGYDANDKKGDPETYKELDDCCKLPKDQKNNSNH